ncbi:MAG: hypothetical protein V3V78_02310 [Candidatus Woesearchaeota archaeon]
MEDKYNDPIKQLSRVEQLAFARKHLASIRAKDIKVVCLPGAMNHEWWIYRNLGVKPQNIVGLESNPERFEVLNQNTHGINIEKITYQEFFRRQIEKGDEGYNIISLDTEDQLNDSFKNIVEIIARNDMIRTPGILITNVYGQREQQPIKDSYAIFDAARSFRYNMVGIEEEQNLSEVKKDPLDLRSDAISECLRLSCVASEEGNLSFMRKMIDFTRKYFPEVDTSNVIEAVEKINETSLFKEDLKKENPNEYGSLLDDISSTGDLLSDFQRDFLTNLVEASNNHIPLACAIRLAFLDPPYVSEHQRLQYLSQTRGNMYMDLLAFNRISISPVADSIKYIKKRLKFKDDTFKLFSHPGEGERQFKRILDKHLTRIQKFYLSYMFDSMNYDYKEERRKLSLPKPKKRKKPSKKEKEKKPIEREIKDLYLSDLLPNKFLERLPANYQKRIEYFVEQINQEGIKKDNLEGIMNSRWYKNGSLPEIRFYSFWDGLYLRARVGKDVSKEDVKRIWNESETGQFTTETPLEKKIKKKRKVNRFIDSKHKWYQKEKAEVVKLFEQGKTIEEVRGLRPRMKKHAIAGISAWFNHRDSWD